MMISITAMPSILALSSADEIDFFFFLRSEVIDEDEMSIRRIIIRQK